MVGASACGPYFPVSYLAEDEPRIISLNLRYDLRLLVNQYYPEAMAGNFCKSDRMSTSEATSIDFGDNPYRAQYLEFDAACRNGVVPASIPEVPENLREFYLYSAGYAEMSGENEVYFPKYWKELLELPAKQRRYRTTWVYYMLGNLALKRDADEAFGYYQKLRKAVSDDDFADSTELAKRSYITNFQNVSDPEKRLKYHAIALANNDNVSSFGLYKLARKIGKEIGEKNPFFLELYLMSGDDSWKVLDKIDKNTKIYVAERLAAVQYFGGNLEGCRKLLEFVPDDSLIKLYLEARFAKREGNTKVAAEKLARWLEIYRESDTVKFRTQYWFSEYGKDWDDRTLSFKQEVKGVLGTILVEQSDFLEAFHAFMEAESWNDAAVVAEEYVKTKDLIEYCTNHTKADSPLRYLLARRLMRENKVAEAGAWFPEKMKGLYQLYVDLSVQANDPGKTPNERALALFEQGRLMFRKGMELRGTETYPDNFIMEGRYEMPTDNWRKKSTPERQTAEVGRRFHYRWIASDMFARAAMLAADPNLRSASLWAAGETIKPRAPKDADVYYKMLCDSVDAPLAAAARESHWFPPCPELGNLIRPEDFNRRLQLSDFEFMNKY